MEDLEIRNRKLHKTDRIQTKIYPDRFNHFSKDDKDDRRHSNDGRHKDDGRHNHYHSSSYPTYPSYYPTIYSSYYPNVYSSYYPSTYYPVNYTPPSTSTVYVVDSKDDDQTKNFYTILAIGAVLLILLILFARK